MFISIFISLYVIEKRRFSDMGLNFRTKDIILLLSGIITCCIFYGVVIFAESLFQGFNSFSQYKDVLISCRERGFIGLIGVSVVPFTEELFYRGYILRNTFEKLKFSQISILAALLFSMPHWQYASGTPVMSFILINMMTTFLFGLLFNNIVRVTKTIWFGAGLHC